MKRAPARNYIDRIAADPRRHAKFPAQSGYTLNLGGAKTNITTPSLHSIVSLPDFFQKPVFLECPYNATSYSLKH
jgi:hypothetical protein